jgi:hypothetical protein
VSGRAFSWPNGVRGDENASDIQRNIASPKPDVWPEITSVSPVTGALRRLFHYHCEIVATQFGLREPSILSGACADGRSCRGDAFRAHAGSALCPWSLGGRERQTERGNGRLNLRVDWPSRTLSAVQISCLGAAVAASPVFGVPLGSMSRR